jgi:anti-anti-sigma factor
VIINKAQENGALVLTLEGRLDTTTAPQFQDALISAFDEAGEVSLDFEKLAYVSSAGLRVLLMGQKTAGGKSASMTICNVSDEIMEIFEMTGFADMLTIV